MRITRITARNARFQQWQALLTNRNKRQRSGEFLVQGVRPITLAAEHGWSFAALLHDADRRPSSWAAALLDAATAERATGPERVAMAPELLAELGGKTDEAPELIAVVRLPPDDLSRIPAGGAGPVVTFDRPNSPGNIGTLIRSADAFGAAGVIVTGHAADVYDPKAVRASTGSLFAVPVVRVPSHREVVAWARANGRGIVGTDEHGTVDLAGHDLTRPSLVVIGNETAGLSAGWREACDHLVRIPMTGSASSLNAAEAATVVLYDAARQRADAAPGSVPG